MGKSHSTQFLVVLDGARGAGKSTVSGLLKEELDGTVFVGLDLVRNLVRNAQATDEFNRMAFDAIFAMAQAFLSNGLNVVVDSGVVAERVEKLKEIANQTSSHILLYHLTAPREILWERITQRGKLRGRMPNPERFNYTYQKQQDKDFSGFTVLDTTQLTPQQITTQIISDV